jgi:hypothetical protein
VGMILGVCPRLGARPTPPRSAVRLLSINPMDERGLTWHGVDLRRRSTDLYGCAWTSVDDLSISERSQVRVLLRPLFPQVGGSLGSSIRTSFALDRRFTVEKLACRRWA